MNELLMALGLQLAIDEISIKVQTFKVFIEASAPTITPSNVSGIVTLSGMNQSYYGVPIFIPSVIWYYQTEFGQQLEKYNQARAQSYQYPGSIYGQSTWSGLYGGTTIRSGAALQGQMSQQSALQQAAAQAQAKYPIISTPYCPPGQLIMQSPTSQVTIKNVQDSSKEEKKPFMQRVKDWFSGTTS